MKRICKFIWNFFEERNLSLGRLAPYILGGMLGSFPHRITSKKPAKK
jgi:hypothetical protein